MNQEKHQSAEVAEGNRLTEKIIGAAIEVHRHTGPSLMEFAYDRSPQSRGGAE